MIIETERNVGDKCWAVAHVRRRVYEPCSAECFESVDDNGRHLNVIVWKGKEYRCPQCAGDGELRYPKTTVEVVPVVVTKIRVWADSPTINVSYEVEWDTSSSYPNGAEIINGTDLGKNKPTLGANLLFYTREEAEARL